tara:strand:- start:206 stop:1048 length:843 start_codon:yes stop_codon:yes gene_type:complete
MDPLGMTRQQREAVRDQGSITLGGRKFRRGEIGEISDFEREYLEGLEQQALGNVNTLAQQQLRRNIGQLAGAQSGIARTLGARNQAAALRGGMQRAEQVRAQGQEELAMLQEQEKQSASDVMRDQILQRISNQRNITAQQKAQEESNRMGLIGSGISALATIGASIMTSGASGLAAMFSDERLKDNKSGEKGESEMRELLAALSPTNYDMGGKNETGILLNEKVENTKAGKEMIRKGPSGLRAIDQPQATKKMLAAMAMLHKDNEDLRGRLAKLEKKGKK